MNLRHERTLRDRLARALQRAQDASLAVGRRKAASRLAAATAERLGLLKRPRCCQGCGRRKPLTRHHRDHEEPLTIAWLCWACHREADGFPDAHD